MTKTTTHTRVINGTTVHVDLDGGPRPLGVVIRIGMVFSVVMLTASVAVGLTLLALASIAWMIFRASERQRIDAIVSEAAEKGAEKHERSRILAYKSLG